MSDLNKAILLASMLGDEFTVEEILDSFEAERRAMIEAEHHRPELCEDPDCDCRGELNP